MVSVVLWHILRQNMQLGTLPAKIKVTKEDFYNSLIHHKMQKPANWRVFYSKKEDVLMTNALTKQHVSEGLYDNLNVKKS